jgi:hypothetical protein
VLGHSRHALPDFLADWGAKATSVAFVVSALIHYACSISGQYCLNTLTYLVINARALQRVRKLNFETARSPGDLILC